MKKLCIQNVPSEDSDQTVNVQTDLNFAKYIIMSKNAFSDIYYLSGIVQNSCQQGMC